MIARKFTHRWLSALILLSLLFSCACAAQPTPTNPPTQTPAPTTPPPTASQQPTKVPPTVPADPVKIEMLYRLPAEKTEDIKEVLTDLQNDFNASHKDIQLEIMMPEPGSLDIYFMLQRGYSINYDIMLPVSVRELATSPEVWLDLSPYIQADNYDLTRFIGPTLKINQSISDGVIGLPLEVYPWVIFFNINMFDAAQLPYLPQEFGAPYKDGDPWTYDKLLEIAKALTLDMKGNNGLSSDFNSKIIKRFGYSHEYYEYAMDYAQKFGDESSLGVSADFKTAAIKTQMFKDAMKWDQEAVWKWHVSPTLGAIGRVNPIEQSAIFEAPSFYASSPNLDEFPADLEWDIAAVPAGSNGKIITLIEALSAVILAGSEHPQEAWVVLKWLFEREQLKPLLESYIYYFAAVPEDAELRQGWVERMAQYYPAMNAQVILDALDYAELVNHTGWRPAYSEVMLMIEEAHREVMAYEDRDVEQILEKLNTDIQAQLDEYWESK